MNPFLYSFMSSQYREGFKAMSTQICCCCARIRNARPAASGSSTGDVDIAAMVTVEVRSSDFANPLSESGEQ
jgi:hypothetical protein